MGQGATDFHFGFTLLDWVSLHLKGWTRWLRVSSLEDCLEKGLGKLLVQAPWDPKLAEEFLCVNTLSHSRASTQFRVQFSDEDAHSATLSGVTEGKTGLRHRVG